MNLRELIKAVTDSIDSHTATDNDRVVLAQSASDIADMVGWAAGPIDPHHRAIEQIQALMERLRGVHEQLPNPAVAALHDALAELNRAIDRHDRDLEQGPVEGEDL
ncbi:MAG: hypothetical protein JSW09_04680 [Pseudomonadota bacterium]|nr:MAG: hypothetical protein JSW09_04680 [Pseudomonadota bacterium]